MKAGDLVRIKNGNQRAGLFLEWKTFDPETNPYTCPVILWQDGRQSTIQSNLIEVISESI